MKASSSGTMLMFSTWLNCLSLLFAAAVESSFCNNKASNIMMEITARDPTLYGVVKIETVEVVTVEIIISPLHEDNNGTTL
jgi:hypothetical protein